MKQISIVFCVVFSLFVTACSKEEVVKNMSNVKAKIEGKDFRYITQERPQEPEKPAVPSDKKKSRKNY